MGIRETNGTWRHWRHGAVAVLALCASAGIAQLPPAFRVAPRVPRAQVQESVAPTPISQPARDMAAAVYGLVPFSPAATVRYPARSGAGDPSFHVLGLGSMQQQLCVSIVRAQGGYRATFVARIPRGQGAAQVSFDSTPEARRKLSEESPSALELALRVTEPQGGKCLVKAPLLPASWQGPSAADWALLVGARNLGTPMTRVAGASMRKCEPLERVLRRTDMRAGNYSYACPVNLSEANCPALVPVQVLWMDGARLVGEARLQVRAPCTGSARG